MSLLNRGAKGIALSFLALAPVWSTASAGAQTPNEEIQQILNNLEEFINGAGYKLDADGPIELELSLSKEEAGKESKVSASMEGITEQEGKPATATVEAVRLRVSRENN